MRDIAYIGCSGLVLLVLFATGCDVLGSTKLKPQPKALSRAQLVRAANRACARSARQVKNIKKPKNPFEALQDFRRYVVPRYERLLFVLRGLTPPPADAVAYRRMLATFNLFDLTFHRALDSIDARQIKQVKRLAKRLDFLGKRIDSRAKRLGLRVCAQT